MTSSFRWIPALTLSALLAGTGSLAQIKQAQPRQLSKVRSEISLEEKLRVGGSQHEIVTVLIEGGHFREAESAFQEILGLGLSGPQEILLVQSAWKVVEKLRNVYQYKIAHRIVGSTLEQVEQVENRHTLLMLRAKIYQEQQNLPKALETLRQAKALGGTLRSLAALGPTFQVPRSTLIESRSNSPQNPEPRTQNLFATDSSRFCSALPAAALPSASCPRSPSSQ